MKKNPKIVQGQPRVILIQEVAKYLLRGVVAGIIF
jgi:hypothetical protein